MKEPLLFIKQCVSVTSLSDTQKYVSFKDGTVQSFNGVVFAQHPIEGVADCIVDGVKLIKGCIHCKWKQAVNVTDKSLLLKHNKLKIRLSQADSFNRKEIKLENKLRLPQNFLEVLQHLQPFISEDASRVWSTSIKIEKGVACTTNNVVIVFIECDSPDMVVPADMVELLLKVKKNPKYVILDKGITFVYDNDAWLHCTGTTDEYPDVSQLAEKRDLKVIDAELHKALVMLCDFDKDGYITFKDGTLSNDEAEYGGFELPNFTYHATPLGNVLKVIYAIDFSQMPTPFVGDNLHGVIMGMA